MIILTNNIITCKKSGFGNFAALNGKNPILKESARLELNLPGPVT